MSNRRNQLSLAILRLVCETPGQTVAQVIDSISQQVPKGETKAPSKDTIRRRIYRLGALGYLSLRQEIVVHPTEKARKLVGHVEAHQDGNPGGL